MKTLIEREIRGFIRTPAFALLILCALPVIAVRDLGRAERTIYAMIAMAPALLLLQDIKTGELHWLLLLPVKRITIFGAKYIAGLAIAELFAIIFSLIPILIHGAPWSFLLSRPMILGAGYSIAFISAYVGMRLF